MLNRDPSEYKQIAEDALELCGGMLSELYYARVHDLIYDQYDKALHDLKEKLEE
jgi:hypothetical protein